MIVPTEIGEMCGGLREAKAEGAGAQTTYKGLTLDVTAGNTLTVSEKGVNLAKIESFTVDDFNKCFKELTGALTDACERLQKPQSNLDQQLRADDRSARANEVRAAIRDTKVVLTKAKRDLELAIQALNYKKEGSRNTSQIIDRLVQERDRQQNLGNETEAARLQAQIDVINQTRQQYLIYPDELHRVEDLEQAVRNLEATLREHEERLAALNN
ncbi:MAG: hypothetical protein L0Z50_25230 [Verrucomicrobiales bacterium]|nr:hypothetical protein [Verrucomicrobiales bacterium]